MENLSNKEGKIAAIISYITILGTIIAFIMNQKERSNFASFHIRQAIGIYLLIFIINLMDRYGGIDWLNDILYIGALVLLVIGLIGAIQGEEKKIPFLGDRFQEWFKNIG